MSQLGRFDYTVITTLGLAVTGASVQVFREGATVNSNQSGTSPKTFNVRHRGKIAAADAVFLNTATGTTYTVDSVTATTVTLSGFAGTLALIGGDRLTPSTSQPTLYNDDQGGASTSNPLTSSATGRVNCWMEFGAYDFVVSGGGATTTAFTAQVVPTQAPGQIRYADEFQYGSSTGGIQEAINDLPAAGGTIILSAGKTYSPTVATSLISNLMIEGNGATIQRSASLDALNVFKDSASALSKVTIRDIIFDNNSRAASAKDISFTGGCTDIVVDGCRWINLSTRVADLTVVNTSASKGARIAWRRNSVVGPGAQQTYNSFQIFDCDNVSVRDNIIDGWGAVKMEGSLAANLFNWNISGNVFKGIAQTNIFCRIQSASSIASISILNNSITDAGKSAIVVGAINAADTGKMFNTSITGNTIKGFALSVADSAINVGGNVTSGTIYMTEVAIVANSIDGLDSTGSQPADQHRGIHMRGGLQFFSCVGNSVRHCGRDGISTQGARDGVICDNSVERCVVQDTSASPPAPATEGGITLYGDNNYPSNNIIVANNHSKNNGVSGAIISYGINVVSDGANNISKIFVHGNRCYDDQGTPTQDYGIKVGALGVTGPNDSLIFDNDCRGNKTGGISGPLGTVTGIFLRNNIPNDGVTQSITAVGNAIVASADRVLLNPNGVYTLTSAPTIADGFWNGQLIELLNVSANTITIQDQGTLPGSNLRLSAATIALGTRDSLLLRYDTTIADWLQVGQTNVT